MFKKLQIFGLVFLKNDALLKSLFLTFKKSSFQSLSVHTNANKDSASKKKTPAGCAAAKVFSRYDVIETSYHLYSDRIDLHLCDDPGGKGRSCHPRLSEGGAFQVSLSQLQVDFYPYHLASGDRSAWIRYQVRYRHKIWYWRPSISSAVLRKYWTLLQSSVFAVFSPLHK